jgi:aspartate/methionine/tyrosine aminotransferase
MFSSRTNWSLNPNRLSELLEERRRRGLPILDLTESNPTRCGFVFDAREVLSALADPRSLTYEPDPRGLLPARQAVVGYYAERGVKLEPAQIFLTTSTSEAYSYVFRLLANPGDNVLAPQPSYPLFDFLAGLNDVEIVPYPLTYEHGWQVDLPALEARLGPRARAILVVHPNNPTGSFIRQHELECLVDCCKQHDLALIADEVFSDYAFAADSRRVVSLAAESRALTFTLSGLSKISALPQMKLAWVVVNGPADLLKDALGRLEVIADTYLSASAPLAHALPRLLESRRRLQPQILERVRRNLTWLDEQLSPDSTLSRLQVEGGWYAILKLPSIRSDEEWAIELLSQDGVLVHPGHFYDFHSDGHLVVSLLPIPAAFQQGLVKVLQRVAQGGPASTKE